MFLQKLEKWRLQQHFKQVDTILRKQNMQNLSREHQHEREKHLKRLAAYADHGIFPRNYDKLPYSPCFIDREGRECAVAHLLTISDHKELADKVVNVANYDYVPEMDFPELDDWIKQSGLSKAELALIQPGYPIVFEGGFQFIAIISWLIGLVVLIVNIFYIKQDQQGRFIPALSLLITTFMLPLAFGLLYFGVLNQSYQDAEDVPQHIVQVALENAQGFLITGIITLILTFIIGSLAIEAWRMNASPSKRKKRPSRLRFLRTWSHNRSQHNKNQHVEK